MHNTLRASAPRHWTHHRLVEGRLEQTQRVVSERSVSRNMALIAGTIACGVFIVTGSVLILMGVNARLPSHRGCWAMVLVDAVARGPLFKNEIMLTNNDGDAGLLRELLRCAAQR